MGFFSKTLIIVLRDVFQEHNLTYGLISESSFSETVTNLVFQSVKEKDIQEEIILCISKLQHEIKNVKKYNLFLERELNSLIVIFDDVAENDMGRSINRIRDEVYDYETRLEELKANTESEEVNNWGEVIENIKKMDQNITDMEENIKKNTHIINNKYKTLPPNIMLARNMLDDLKNKYKELDEKVKHILTNRTT